MEETQQAKFEGFAVIELMGHNKEIGYVTTQYFGGPALFRVDRPELSEREFELKRPQYVDHKWCPAGAKVKRPALPAKTALIGPPAIFRITPCTELMAIEAIEEMMAPPLILLSLPERVHIAAGEEPDRDPDDNRDDEDMPF